MSRAKAASHAKASGVLHATLGELGTVRAAERLGKWLSNISLYIYSSLLRGGLTAKRSAARLIWLSVTAVSAMPLSVSIHE